MNYQIKNDKITMVISSLGAEPQSLVFENREYLWQGDKTYWFRRAPLLFPMIGPTRDNKISVNGVLYDMPNNGFARDTEFTFVEKTKFYFSSTFSLKVVLITKICISSIIKFFNNTFSCKNLFFKNS